MKREEILTIFAAIILLTIVSGFSLAIEGNWSMIPTTFLFSVIIITLVILSKKLMASWLDADIEHEIWKFRRYGLKKHQKLGKEIPIGIILPTIITLFTLGTIEFSALLTYEARALKRRAAKRFGFYSFTELTEWHNGLIGAAGIITCLLIATISYFLPFNLEFLAKMASFHALSNMIPVSRLDGTQIFFGSRVLWTVLALLALIFGAYAFIL